MKKAIIILFVILLVLQMCLFAVSISDYAKLLGIVEKPKTIFNNEGLWVYLKPLLPVIERLMVILVEVFIAIYLLIRGGIKNTEY